MTVTLLWKCNKLIVTQHELLRYYRNAVKDLTCHSIVIIFGITALYERQSTSEVEAAGCLFFVFPDNGIFTGWDCQHRAQPP
jgi:hypothetical protein